MPKVPTARTPWPGLLSLAGMVGCLVAAAVVIGASHNGVVASWDIQPSVLLAILSATSGVLSSIALETGVAVRFWLGASNGAPLSQLHYVWDHGRGLSLVHAIRAGSAARIVAILATCACLLQFLASPLLQRSTYQTLKDDSGSESMTIDIATRIPDGWFGPLDQDEGGLFEVRNGLTELRDWWEKAPILTQDRDGYRCSGICHGNIPGAGLSYDCWSVAEKLDLSTPKTDNRTVFMVGLMMIQNVTNEPFLRLRTKNLAEVDSNCMGTVETNICYIKAATVEYPITIKNTTVSIRADEVAQIKTISAYFSPGDFPDAPTGSPAGPLIGLRHLVMNVLSGNITKSYDPNMNRSSYVGSGWLADIFSVPPGQNENPSPSMCRLRFNSPTDYVLGVMHEFMLRFALAAGKTNDDDTDKKNTQTFTVQHTARVLIYQVDPAFLAGSLAAMACGIIFLGALIWNWWRLERPLTLSPLETAAALGRPLLEDHPYATLDEILAAESREMKLVRQSTTRPTSDTSSSNLNRVAQEKTSAQIETDELV